jgi:hypothetical protein
MLRHHAFILVTAGGLCAAAVTLCPGQAIAGSISPSSFNASIAIGETVKVVKKIATDAGPGLVDFLLLADNTGSMDGVINNVKSVANQLVTDLKTTYAGAQFAVARYLGDPSEPLENFSSAYQVIQKNTASEINTVAAINSWFANGGDDYPEANFYALQQGIQNGASTCPGLGSTLGFCGTSGQTVDWRPSARKVVLWFGDAPSQQTTVTMNNIKAILASENASLVALNSGPATTALDDTYGFGGQAGNQASSVTSSLGTNGALINSFASVPIGDIVTTVKNAVGAVTNTQDISLKVLGSVPTGLEVSFDCTDPLGCNDVIGGESRNITMAVKGLAAGDYNFSVIAPGVVGAIEQDRILVSDEDVSVPGPLPLLGVSAAFGWSRRLRRSMQKREALATPT